MGRTGAGARSHAHAGQRFRHLLQQQRIRLQRIINLAELLSKSRLLGGELILKIGDAVGNIVLLSLVLRQIDVDQPLGRVGQINQVGMKNIGETQWPLCSGKKLETPADYWPALDSWFVLTACCLSSEFRHRSC
jgi:hypothetical protein